MGLPGRGTPTQFLRLFCRATVSAGCPLGSSLRDTPHIMSLQALHVLMAIRHSRSGSRASLTEASSCALKSEMDH